MPIIAFDCAENPETTPDRPCTKCFTCTSKDTMTLKIGTVVVLPDFCIGIVAFATLSEYELVEPWKQLGAGPWIFPAGYGKELERPTNVADRVIESIISTMEQGGRGDLAHYAGACWRDDAAWQVVLDWFSHWQIGPVWPYSTNED